MPFIPKLFPDLGKACTDFFKDKNYDLKRTLEIKTTSQNPKSKITITAKSDDGTTALTLKDKITCDGAKGDFEVEVSEAGLKSISLKDAELGDGLSIGVGRSTKDGDSVTIKYQRENMS